MVHARIRVRRTWDGRAKTFTTPKSRRAERAVPMPDVVAGGAQAALARHAPRPARAGPPDALVFADPATGQPMEPEPGCTPACARP